jgi:CHAD domain-containing protein
MYRFNDFFDEIKKKARLLDKDLKKISSSNDPEVVHRCRVNIRKIKGVLKLFNCPEDISGDIKEIFFLLGPLRDIEVQIDFLNSRVDTDPHLIKILDELLYDREILKRKIVDIIPEFSYKKFIADLEETMKGKELYKYDIYRKLYNKISGIIDLWPIPVETSEIHELRIKMKKIRYMLETLFIKKDMYGEFIHKFKNYQDSLGEIHDIDVWMGVLEDRWPEYHEFRSFLRKKRHRKISEFKNIFNEIPSTLKNILRVTIVDLSKVFDSGQEFRSIKQSEANKLIMAEKLSVGLTPDPEHAMRVRDKSVKIFEELKDYLVLKPFDRFFLEAAALLHDIGYSIIGGEHNVNSFELISSSQYLPFSLRERIIISLIARNHRGEIMLSDKLKVTLPPKEVKKIIKLSSILKAADGMEIESLEYVKDFKLTVDDLDLVFDIGAVSEELDRRFLKKVKLLRKVFKKTSLNKIKKE